MLLALVFRGEGARLGLTVFFFSGSPAAVVSFAAFAAFTARVGEAAADGLAREAECKSLVAENCTPG